MGDTFGLLPHQSHVGGSQMVPPDSAEGQENERKAAGREIKGMSLELHQLP